MVPNLSVEGGNQELWDLRSLDDSWTARSVCFDVGCDDVGYVGFEVFEERGSEGGTIDLSIVDADIVRVLICGGKTLLHESKGLIDLEGVFNPGGES